MHKDANMKIKIHLTVIVLLFLIIAGIFFAGCGFGKQSITSDQAIKIAEERVKSDGVMSMDGRFPVAKSEKDNWHVSFPISLPFVLGGEPHVIVDKASGKIIEVYYTQ